ncbi:Uncharacterized UPF0721 integral membrane protein [hydrothermal vent metagenome]|uniref:Uncharacterized UPF0721 integral membrane protein n=1 Tax=hydrothermal vent metagenome TaxID=652676 RepID=A0A3B0ZW58_9ZZZZ
MQSIAEVFFSLSAQLISPAMMTEFILFIILGCFAGFTGGLLGLGGGLILVPAFIFIFVYLGESMDVAPHLAIGTSLAIITISSLSSAYGHTRYGHVLWPVVFILTPGLIVGVLIGVVIADQLPGSVLKILFGVFAITIAIYMWLGNPQPAVCRALTRKASLIAGMIIGTLSAIIGIGGGSMVTPFLMWNGYQIQQAVAVAAATGFPIAVSGAIGFIWMGSDAIITLDDTWGYVYWPAFIVVAAVAAAVAPLGARMAHLWSKEKLKRFFSLFLMLLGLLMVFQ